jgi:hypothetical protein
MKMRIFPNRPAGPAGAKGLTIPHRGRREHSGGQPGKIVPPKAKGRQMPQVTIVYWRDIPAQVIVGRGRAASKRPLSERFEQAIDRCAMKIGARDADLYMAEWRKAAPVEAPGAADDVARSFAERIERAYDTEKLRALIANDGWEEVRPQENREQE